LVTKAQRKALDWLADHGNDGIFCNGGTAVLARGEIAPFDRVTWQRLEQAGLVETYGARRHGGKGHGRIRVK
jgi:ABC-type sugar transport system substrate-binding protein